MHKEEDVKQASPRGLCRGRAEAPRAHNAPLDSSSQNQLRPTVCTLPLPRNTCDENSALLEIESRSHVQLGRDPGAAHWGKKNREEVKLHPKEERRHCRRGDQPDRERSRRGMPTTTWSLTGQKCLPWRSADRLSTTTRPSAWGGCKRTTSDPQSAAEESPPPRAELVPPAEEKRHADQTK